jgi:hypothetical protein
MDNADLLHWHYLLYLLPLSIAALFLALSSVRIGARGSHRTSARGAHVRAQGTAARGTAHAKGSANAPKTATHAKAAPHAKTAAHARGGHAKAGRGAKSSRTQALASHFDVLGLLFGIGRAPSSMLIQTFCLCWGFAGYWANRLLIKVPDPTLMQMLPSLGVALAGGYLGSRLFAEAFARIMPREESFDVSHEQLFGMTGRITFPADEASGRIRIYDAYGTLHDEPCFVSAGHPPISKGGSAIVVDMDIKGRLIVEELPKGMEGDI